MLSTFFHSCTSILFPSRCFVCRKKEEAVCSSCMARSRKALDTPHPYIMSLFSFKEKAIQRAIHAIKYYHRKDLIPPLACAVALEFKKTNNQLLAAHDWILVPVPMPALRKLLRGYNQAELIAYALGKELLLPVRTDILKRNRSPLRQVRTSARDERLQNQKGSFATKESPFGMHIILVDDVTTTGATLSEACRTLLAKKATNVLAITLAH